TEIGIHVAWYVWCQLIEADRLSLPVFPLIQETVDAIGRADLIQSESLRSQLLSVQSALARSQPICIGLQTAAGVRRAHRSRIEISGPVLGQCVEADDGGDLPGGQVLG